MDELIERLVAKLGAEQAVAKKAVGIVVQIPVEPDPARTIHVDNDLSIAAAPILATKSDAKLGNRHSGARVPAHTRGFCDRMTVAGTRMGRIRPVSRLVDGFAHEKIGDDVSGESVGTILGLGQLA
jgi:hypothetical protein